MTSFSSLTTESRCSSSGKRPSTYTLSTCTRHCVWAYDAGRLGHYSTIAAHHMVVHTSLLALVCLLDHLNAVLVQSARLTC